MQCTSSFLPATSPFIPNKERTSKPNSLNFQPRNKILCFSQTYDSASDEDDDNNWQSSIKSLPLPHHLNSITSTSNPFVKHCVKLRNSSAYRCSHGSVLLVGSTPIRELYQFQGKMQDGKTKIECLLMLENADIPEDLNNLYIRRVCVSSMVMKKLSGLQSTDCLDMVALVRMPSTFRNVVDNLQEEDCRAWFPFPHRILVLDGIQDPGNLGTLLRSALAFGWDGVFLLYGCCDPFNEKALRASRGASFQLPIVSGEWTHLKSLKEEFEMRILAGHPANSAESKLVSSLSRDFADSLAETPLCLVLGSEGSGLSEKSRQECELVSIPMAGEFESLNVSVAGGIFLYMLQPNNSGSN
ncbi:hypothetical protein M9H77_19583 [Catharanthus roseus]|uniref:Uncharacterized protein n=1 Tax=Catharanthus roseus TaxID=4058 RepID=A0ACC0BAT2_CATRO|nr:hypothetical protein M9H77_19583 [Catharanthus roseus]